MTLTVCSWNINSLRLRESSVLRILKQESPDILCLQECKSPTKLMPQENFAKLGYSLLARGQKSYNGVAILSRLPMVNKGFQNFAGKNEARHLSIQLNNEVMIDNFYVPAGGDIADADKNEKFAYKLAYLDAMRDYFNQKRPKKSILLGDLNIAPYPDDVWDHKKLQKVVSHTPIECEQLKVVQDSAGWVDIIRQDIPDGKLYSWWSYRARDWVKANKGRRLDHIWATADLASVAHSGRIYRAARGWNRPSDHAPVFASFDL